MDSFHCKFLLSLHILSVQVVPLARSQGRCVPMILSTLRRSEKLSLAVVYCLLTVHSTCRFVSEGEAQMLSCAEFLWRERNTIWGMWERPIQNNPKALISMGHLTLFHLYRDMLTLFYFRRPEECMSLQAFHRPWLQISCVSLSCKAFGPVLNIYSSIPWDFGLEPPKMLGRHQRQWR